MNYDAKLKMVDSSHDSESSPSSEIEYEYDIIHWPKNYDDELFITNKGEHISFVLCCKFAEEIQSIIKRGGGVVYSVPDGLHDAILYAPYSNIPHRQQVYSIEYIKACCRENELLDINWYRLNSKSIYPPDFNAMDVLQKKITWPVPKNLPNESDIHVKRYHNLATNDAVCNNNKTTIETNKEHLSLRPKPEEKVCKKLQLHTDTDMFCNNPSTSNNDHIRSGDKDHHPVQTTSEAIHKVSLHTDESGTSEERQHLRVLSCEPSSKTVMEACNLQSNLAQEHNVITITENHETPEATVATGPHSCSKRNHKGINQDPNRADIADTHNTQLYSRKKPKAATHTKKVKTGKEFQQDNCIQQIPSIGLTECRWDSDSSSDESKWTSNRNAKTIYGKHPNTTQNTKDKETTSLNGKLNDIYKIIHPYKSSTENKNVVYASDEWCNSVQKHTRDIGHLLRQLYHKKFGSCNTTYSSNESVYGAYVSNGTHVLEPKQRGESSMDTHLYTEQNNCYNKTNDLLEETVSTNKGSSHLPKPHKPEGRIIADSNRSNKRSIPKYSSEEMFSDAEDNVCIDDDDEWLDPLQKLKRTADQVRPLNNKRMTKTDENRSQSSNETIADVKMKKWNHKGKRRDYTFEEKRAIIDYISKHKCYDKVKGREIWQLMVDFKICRDRTWQSMKEHFIKQIIPNITYFNLPKVEIMAFRKPFQ